MTELEKAIHDAEVRGFERGLLAATAVLLGKKTTEKLKSALAGKGNDGKPVQ